MPKFPEPPPAGELIGRCPAEELVLPSGQLLFRVYFRGGSYGSSWNTFRHYGPTGSRFDHHAPPPHKQARGIYYAATNPGICLAEVFQDQSSRNIDRSRNDPWLVGFELARAVRLLDLCVAWPTRAGASQAITSGQKARARRWSNRIFEDYPSVEGLCHLSSLDASVRCVTLYERAEDALPTTHVFHRALADPTIHFVIDDVAWRFGYTVHP
jgi:hypothetical protein